jgi:hypothetical protein
VHEVVLRSRDKDRTGPGPNTMPFVLILWPADASGAASKSKSTWLRLNVDFENRKSSKKMTQLRSISRSGNEWEVGVTNVAGGGKRFIKGLRTKDFPSFPCFPHRVIHFLSGGLPPEIGECWTLGLPLRSHWHVVRHGPLGTIFQFLCARAQLFLVIFQNLQPIGFVD